LCLLFVAVVPSKVALELGFFFFSQKLIRDQIKPKFVSLSTLGSRTLHKQ